METTSLAKGHQRTVAQNSIVVLQSSKTFLSTSKPGFRSPVKRFRHPTLFAWKGGRGGKIFVRNTLIRLSKDQKGPSKQKKKPKLDWLGRMTYPLNKYSLTFLSWGVVAKCCRLVIDKKVYTFSITKGSTQLPKEFKGLYSFTG